MSDPVKLSDVPFKPPFEPLSGAERAQVCRRCHHRRGQHFGARGKQCPSRYDVSKPGTGEWLPPEGVREQDHWTETEKVEEREMCEMWDEVLP